MEDIAPELYKKINDDFTAAVRNDSTIRTLVTKGNSRPLTQKELTTISTRLGQHASDAFKKTLTVDALPDGKMYWNIADRTIRPIMQRIYDTNNLLESNALKLKDKAAGVNIGIIKGADPTARINEVIQFTLDSKTAEELDNALNLPVKTTALDFNDDFMEANAELRGKLGFKQVITREYDGVGLANGRRPCNWCIGRSGTYYSYQEAKDAGAFERHTGCGCTIDWNTTDEVENDEYNSAVNVPF